MKKELGTHIWLYTFNTFYPNEPIEFTPEFLLNNTQDLEEYRSALNFPIWNTSEKQDKWLIKNCNIQSFRNRILEVYPKNWSGFKGQKWIPKTKEKPKYKRNGI